jgi:adenosylmethionine-8-amino-7-oxononanoate aminotransferase
MSTGGAAVISDAVNLTPKLAEVFGAKNGQTAVATIVRLSLIYQEE